MELKARFDEENNLATAEMMKAAGINIIYSIPGLKVHAKVALIRRRSFTGEKIHSYAYISTGNFNEKTATLYADCGLFTSNPVIVHDLTNLFRTLRGKENPRFTRLLVARFNLIPELNRLIDKEIELAEKGRGGRIILKMNALQDPIMIDRLYEASQKGVKIDLIVRGICCLIPDKNIVVTYVSPVLWTVFWNMPASGISVMPDIPKYIWVHRTGCVVTYIDESKRWYPFSIMNYGKKSSICFISSYRTIKRLASSMIN